MKLIPVELPIEELRALVSILGDFVDTEREFAAEGEATEKSPGYEELHTRLTQLLKTNEVLLWKPYKVSIRCTASGTHVFQVRAADGPAAELKALGLAEETGFDFSPVEYEIDSCEEEENGTQPEVE